MKKMFLILCCAFLSRISLAQSSKTKRSEEHYILTQSGEHKDLNYLKRVTADTLYFFLNNTMLSILLDDVSGYHHYKPSRNGSKGFWTGAGIGATTGALIGAVFLKSEEQDVDKGFTKLTYAVYGAGIGLAACGIAGLVLGKAPLVNEDIDMKSSSKQRKSQVFNAMISK